MRRESLFSAWWSDQDGHRLRRATRAEIAAAHRLWWRHKDLREPRKRFARVILIDDDEAAA